MKPDIHPQYKEVTVTCSCGSIFTTRSTLGKDSISLEVCSKCHPFYTGTQKIMDTAGRVDRFRQKYGMKGQKEVVKNAAEPTATTEAPKKAEAKPAAKAPEKKVEAKKADSKKAEGKKATSKKVAKDDKKAE